MSHKLFNSESIFLVLSLSALLCFECQVSPCDVSTFDIVLLYLYNKRTFGMACMDQ